MTTVTVAQKRLVRFQDLVSGEGERNSNSNNNNTDRLPILPLPQNTQRNRNESPLLFSPLFAHQPPKLLHSIFSPASLKAGENVAVSRVALSGICLNLDPGGEDFDENESQLQSQSAQQPKYYVFQTNAGTGGPFLGPFDSNRRPIPNHSPIHRHGQNGYENQNYKYNYSRFAGQENEPPKSNAHAPTRTIAVSGSKINTTRSVRNLPMSPLFQVPAPVGGTRDVKIDRSAYRYELEQQQLQVQLKSQPKNPKSTTGRPNSNFNSKSLDVTTILLTPSSTDLSSLANSMESNLFDSSRSFFQTPQSHDHHSPPTSLLQLPVRPTTPALTVASFPTLEKSDWLSFDFISQCDRASQLVRITTALQSPRNNNMYPSLLRAAQNRLTQLHQLQHHHQECTDRRFEATPISDNSDSDSDSSSLVMSISTTTIDAFASDVGNAHFTTDSADIYPRRGSAHHAASYLSSPSVVPHSTPSTTFRRTASTVGCSKQELLRMIHEGNHQNAQLKKEMEHLSAVHNQHIEQQAAKMEVQNNYLDSSGWTEAAKRQLEATQAEHSIDRNRLEQQKQSLSALLTTAQADIVRLQKDLDVLLRAMQLAVESEMEIQTEGDREAFLLLFQEHQRKMKNAILESQRLHTMAIDAQLKSEGLLVESTRCRRSIEQDCFHMSQQLESQTQEKNSILGDLDEALEREKNYRKVIQELKQQLSKTDNMVSAKMYRAVIAQCNQQNHENMVENAPQTNRNGVRVGPFLVKPSTPPKATPKQQSRAIASAGHPNNKGTKENIQIAPETDRHMSVPTVASVAASVGIDLMSVKAAARSLPRRLKPCIKNPTIVEASQNCRTPRLPTGPKPILKSKTPSRLEFPSPPQNRDCRSRRRASWVRENGGRISVQKKLQDSRSPTVNAKQINVDAKRQMYQQKLNEMNVFPTPPLV